MAPVEALAAQHLGRREAGRSAADDDDPRVWRAGAPPRGAGVGSTFSRTNDSVAARSTRQQRHRIEGRRAQRLAGAQAEAGVVPRAAHRVADDEPLGERAAVVRAFAADGEDFALGPRQDHRILADMSAEHGVGRKVALGDPVREVGSARFIARFRHGIPPASVFLPVT